eukprot:Awhi_evm1s12866
MVSAMSISGSDPYLSIKLVNGLTWESWLPIRQSAIEYHRTPGPCFNLPIFVAENNIEELSLLVKGMIQWTYEEKLKNRNRAPDTSAGESRNGDRETGSIAKQGWLIRQEQHRQDRQRLFTKQPQAQQQPQQRVQYVRPDSNPEPEEQQQIPCEDDVLPPYTLPSYESEFPESTHESHFAESSSSRNHFLPPSKVSFCTQCGSPRDENDHFCGQCGHNLDL